MRNSSPAVVKIEPGSSPRSQNLDEENVDVAIDYALAIGWFEVTVGEFRPFAAETGLQTNDFVRCFKPRAIRSMRMAAGTMRVSGRGMHIPFHA